MVLDLDRPVLAYLLSKSSAGMALRPADTAPALASEIHAGSRNLFGSQNMHPGGEGFASAWFRDAEGGLQILHKGTSRPRPSACLISCAGAGETTDSSLSAWQPALDRPLVTKIYRLTSTYLPLADRVEIDRRLEIWPSGFQALIAGRTIASAMLPAYFQVLQALVGGWSGSPARSPDRVLVETIPQRKSPCRRTGAAGRSTLPTGWVEKIS